MVDDSWDESSARSREILAPMKNLQEQSKVEEDDPYTAFDYRKADLNKLDDDELKAHKAAMDVKFQQNAVKKGDPGFVYDKRVTFKIDTENAESNSWDESSGQSKSARNEPNTTSYGK